MQITIFHHASTLHNFVPLSIQYFQNSTIENLTEKYIVNVKKNDDEKISNEKK